ncbi:uncharacterized protein LOC131873566 [Cryptomeria japonica]|uniref:uncharacterized protein LOC131873566 n=1 Tax=Cryptomeria japonica TaxID=3369 RepID=UPI0027DAA4EE|nr:uncharacterized protein LOC131873566 [Cryptomeria japonica]
MEKGREIQPHHQIHVIVDNRQADFKASPIQLDGKLFGHAVSILINTSATECFVDPRVVSKLNVKPGYVSKPWNVQYGNQAERMVDQCLACSELLLPNFLTEVNLYVAPLGSYDVILGINWLTEHKAIVNCEDKLVECSDDLGNQVKIQGDTNPLQLRQISAMQLKQAERKGCEIYSMHIKDLREDNTGLDTHPIIREFQDVFPEELPGMPPKREFDFTIDLHPGTKPQSKAPYRMATMELYELKVQL